MTERIDTVVIGAGQAGLSASYHLSQAGREHVVLERGRVAETWRTKRWDGFYLNTPKWTQQLPGHEYDGREPDAFSSLREAISYLDEYASSDRGALAHRREVAGMRPVADGFEVEANDGLLHAANVVVATGAYQEPTPTPVGEKSPRTSSSCTRATTNARSNCPKAACWSSAAASPAARSPTS